MQSAEKSDYASYAQALFSVSLRMIWRKKNEIVEKSFVSGDRRGALSGQRGRDWHAERAGKRGNGAVGECVCAGVV